MDTHDSILAICHTAFPDQPTLSLESLNPLAGSDHAMQVFHLRSGPDSSHPLILRRYTSPLVWHHLEESGRAAREFAVLNHLRDAGFPVPIPHAHGHDEQGDWLLLDAISGRNWWQPLGLVDFDRVLPGVVKQHVTWLVRLHALDPAPLTAALPTIRAADVLAAYQERAAFVARHDPNEGILRAALRRAGELVAQDEEQPSRLLNGDATVANLIVAPSGDLAAWLDWDQAAIGDPRWDVACPVTSLRGGYQMDDLARRAVSQYEHDSVRRVANLQGWLALVAVLRWAACAWLKAAEKTGQTFDFPAKAHFIEAYDSHRAWAMTMLEEAEGEEEE
jgi:aminoglycoside phosphotransferase (APT) family kinase protein